MNLKEFLFIYASVLNGSAVTTASLGVFLSTQCYGAPE